MCAGSETSVIETHFVPRIIVSKRNIPAPKTRAKMLKQWKKQILALKSVISAPDQLN